VRWAPARLVSRLTRRGLLATSRYGRNTYYGLTGRAVRVLEAGRRRIMSFGECSGDWDGRWTVAAFSLPEERRDLRHALRVQLRWLGFGPLYDGMWVSPRASAGETREMLDTFKITNATVLRAREPGGSAGGHSSRRRDARNVFVEVYDGLGPLAVIRVRQVLARFAPEPTGHVRYLNIKDTPGPSSRP
jgi:hypothetical protein